MNGFKAAHAAAEDWAHTAQACVSGLGVLPEGANFGFLYLTDNLVDNLANILLYLRQRTGVLDWVGSVGIGICGGPCEYFDRPAMAVMVGALPADSYRVFPAVSENIDQLLEADADWIARVGPASGVVHGCPENPRTASLVFDLREATGAFLTGGVTSSRWSCSQIAGRITGGGVSGALFGSEVGIATCLSQGCKPLAGSHVISDCLDNVIIGLDGRRAMEVFAEELGTRYREDSLSAARQVRVAIPVEESDTGDYLVREIVGIDSGRGWLAVGNQVQPGDRLLFVERDAETARADLERSLSRLKARLDGPPRGGLYVSCIARGPGMFGKAGAEVGVVRSVFGDIPLVGFFSNGEISNGRIYGHTGVLTLFT